MGKKLQRRTTAGLGVAAGAGAALLFSLGNAPFAGAQPDDTTLTDLLGAQTDQFGVFSNNITDNLQASTAGDNAIFGDYLNGLANPDVNNGAALDGLDEVSTQLNQQLANTNANDVNGLDAVLGADNNVFGNVGGGTESATPTADQIAAVLSNNGVTDADFTGGTLNDAAAALAANPHTDVFGDDVIAGVFNGTGHGNGTGVFSALQDAGIFAGGQPNQPDVEDTLIANDLNGATPVTGGEGGGGGLTDPALSDALGAQTDQFGVYSNNLTDNLLASANGDAGIYSTFLDGLSNGVNNGFALDGLDEVSGQLNDQLANSNATDLNGFEDTLGADFTNLGDFLNLGDVAGI